MRGNGGLRKHFSGRVFTGSGEASHFTGLPWFREFVHNKFGLDVCPGTLNLKAASESDVSVLESLRSSSAKFILDSPDPLYCSAMMFKANVQSANAAIVVPKIKNYPRDVCELVSDLNLRKGLSLLDGDVVEVVIEA